MKSTPSPATTTRTQRKEKKNASKAKKKKGSNSPRSSVPVYIIIGELLFLYRELRTYLKTTTTTITDTATGERKQKQQQQKKKTGKKKNKQLSFSRWSSGNVHQTKWRSREKKKKTWWTTFLFYYLWDRDTPATRIGSLVVKQGKKEGGRGREGGKKKHRNANKVIAVASFFFFLISLYIAYKHLLARGVELRSKKNKTYVAELSGSTCNEEEWWQTHWNNIQVS